jgi:N-acetylglucosamine kinase-like BadF-type ATPase
MFLIAESGASKCAWKIEGESDLYYTEGLNPYFHTSETVQHLLRDQPMLDAVRAEVTDIRFYGAGCSQGEKAMEMKRWLGQFFPHAAIKVASDLEAAAVAAYGEQSGLIAILGTGCNAAWYPGNQQHVLTHAVSLGYAMGDEGSGADIGRRLIKRIAYNQLDNELCALFFAETELDFPTILHRVYKEPAPSKFLASFCPFVNKHIDHTQMRSLVLEAFDEFISGMLAANRHAEDQNSFAAVGSIAFYFSQLLELSAQKAGLRVSSIVCSPIDAL